MNLVFFEMAPPEIPTVEAAGLPALVLCETEPLSAENITQHADAEIISTFVSGALGRDVLSRLPRLKFIATRSTGVDHIDLDYCRENGIGVANVPDYGDSTVAEHAFALLLAVGRRIVECAQQTRESNFGYMPAPGFELHGKTLGIIGTGRIGQRAIEMARGFGMRVLAYDRYPQAALTERLSFQYTTLEALLAAADVISLHIPATPEAVNMLSDAQFDRMKAGVILINTARGALVDAAALIRALSSGKVAAAGLDVLAQESLIRDETRYFRAPGQNPAMIAADTLADHVLARMPNVLITPHNAYNTTEARQRILQTTVENIRDFLQGGKSHRIV